MSGGALLSGFAGGFKSGEGIKRDKRRDDLLDDILSRTGSPAPDRPAYDGGETRPRARPHEAPIPPSIPDDRARASNPAPVTRNTAMADNGGPTKAAAGDWDLGARISETAAALEMDPVDLATIISYETAGTFDPMKKGPTTQHGQHKGFIQWGEPQAKQYGVDWDNPVDSQLGPDGAIVRYFKGRGWKPGMGMMDAYSIVNAGAPGLQNRSDANNGGAPGSVADKVNNQMAAHRAKAAKLFSRGAPQAAPAPTRRAPPAETARSIRVPLAETAGPQAQAAPSSRAPQFRAPLEQAAVAPPPEPTYSPFDRPQRRDDPILKFTLDKVGTV